MKSLRLFSLICLVAVMLFFIQGCSKSDSYNAGDNGGGDPTSVNYISIQSMQFQPATITVLPGSKIIWTNTDAMAHTVTSDDGISFNSGTINPGATFTYTATTQGTYAYHCNFHAGMTGTIYVATR